MSDVTPAEKAAEALDDAIQYIERNQCSHEDTYRAGTIWTICSACGQKWADDEGGFQPAETPQVVVRARAALAALRSPADAQTPVGVEAVAYRWRHISRSTGWFYSGDGDGLAEGTHEFEPLYSAADMARVMGERDEADRRAGASERSLSHLREQERARDGWMRERKRELGYTDNTSFDEVWADTAAKAARAEAAEKEAAALRALLRETDCPRPCNGRPDDFSAGQCFDAGECGCGVRAALTQGGTDGR